MPMPTDDQILAVLSECGGNKTEAAKRLGIHRGTLLHRLMRIQLRKDGVDAESPGRPEWVEDHKRDVVVVESHGSRIRTAEDAIAKAALDPDIWAVERVVVNGWDVTMKVRQGAGEPDQVQRSQNQQIKVWFRRRVPEVVEDAFLRLMGRMRNAAPKYPRVKRPTHKGSQHLYEVSVFDAHFGKLCWAPEVGENYDLKIAEKVYSSAVTDLLHKAEGFPIEEILFTIGQDFFHTNDPSNLTPRNRNMLDVDGRFGKIWATATEAVVNALLVCAQVAPVKVLWVPGNHDPESSFFLAEFARGRLWNHPDITFDNSPDPRKAYIYGVNFIGFTHGCDEKHNDLPVIFEQQYRDRLAGIRNTEIHLGHWHKRKSVRWVDVDTKAAGWVVRVLPSLSGTDFWHHSKGYVNPQRAAEAYLYERSRGYVAHFSSNILRDDP